LYALTAVLIGVPERCRGILGGQKGKRAVPFEILHTGWKEVVSLTLLLLNESVCGFWTKCFILFIVFSALVIITVQKH
jgi:hypothetical protein